jgi:hypothetical protein|nr:hypothetical protein [uncultured Schaedlerella sp.]
MAQLVPGSFCFYSSETASQAAMPAWIFGGCDKILNENIIF